MHNLLRRSSTVSGTDTPVMVCSQNLERLPVQSISTRTERELERGGTRPGLGALNGQFPRSMRGEGFRGADRLPAQICVWSGLVLIKKVLE